MIANAAVALFPSAHLWFISWRGLIIALAVMAAVCSILHGVYLSVEEKNREQKEQDGDKRFEDLASQLLKRRKSRGRAFDAMPEAELRPFHYQAVSRTPPLRDRIEAIARELFTFLRERDGAE